MEIILNVMESFYQREDGVSFSEKIEQAREYWKGNVKNELPELLINEKTEVVEIIQDYTKSNS